MNTVIVALNPLEPDTWTTHEADDVCAFLVEHFAQWPSTARIYHNNVSDVHDITPSCEADIERLQQLKGTFYVIVYPGDPVTIIYAVVAIVVIAAVALMRPAVPNPALRNTQQQSPNNELSERTNKPRPLARIPDVFGTVRSTPDLIAVPYKVFENHEEVEYAYMCIGRGAYDVTDIRDDTTLVSDIAGASVEVFAPYTSPNSEAAPQLRIGTPINSKVLNVKRSNSVNGQVLRAPDSQYIRGDRNINFLSPNQITTVSFDFTARFASGDQLTVSHAAVYESYILDQKDIVAFNDGSFRFAIPSATLPSEYTEGKDITLSGAMFSLYDPDGFLLNTYNLDGVYTIESVALATESGSAPPPSSLYYCKVTLVNPASINPTWNDLPSSVGPKTTAIKVPSGAELYNLNGVYTVLSVSEGLIVLSDPASVNSAWASLTSLTDSSPTLSTSGPKWIGPFIMEGDNTSEIYANFVALNGLYKDDGKNQYRIDILIALEVTPVNKDNSVRGPSETFYIEVQGSATYRSTRAGTLKCKLSIPGRCSIRAYRVTTSWLDFEGSVVDEVKWRDVYSVAPVNVAHFGYVTTVHSVTYATSGALALKERKLNMLATRKLPTRISGSDFTEELYATNQVDDILSFICLDRHMGNRNPSEIDFNSIYATVAEVRGYFGHEVASEFSYTFDSDNLSFEETVQAVANAVFCIAYRRGSILKLSFEKRTDDSVLLFNHRNKLPGTETRTIRFGNQNNFDGVSYQYVDPDDDALVTYYIPEDRSAINPQELESMGVRSKLQAYFHAWRAWNKIRYQNIITEFQATQEADLLVPQDRILVADNTRSGIQDGEVVEQNVLELKLSQEVKNVSGSKYSIFLQHIDGTVESIPVRPGRTSRHVILERAPRLPLAVSDGLYARAGYILAAGETPSENAFLVVEKAPQGNFTSTIRAVNYEDRYYSNDKDFINNIVDSNGNPVS